MKTYLLQRKSYAPSPTSTVMAEKTHLNGFNSDTLFPQVFVFCNILLIIVREIENPIEEEYFL